MKYTAQDESRVANAARGKAECYICHKTLIKSCILSYKRSGSVLSVLLYFTLGKVSLIVHKRMFYIRTNLRMLQHSNVECNIRMFVLCNKMMYFGDFVVLAA